MLDGLEEVLMMAEHTCQHNHTKTEGHSHTHDHGTLPRNVYFAGLLLFILALFVPNQWVKDGFYFAAVLLAGYHISWEGIEDTIKSTRANRRFTPNVHLLMLLAAIGSMVIGNFNEAALLILIFAGAHFLEEYAEGQSRREITNLLKLNPTEARLMGPDGKTKKIAASEIKKEIFCKCCLVIS